MAKTALAALILVGILGPTPASALVVTNFTDLGAYLAAAGAQDSITFTEVPVGSILGTQYAGLGVDFPEGDEFVIALDTFVVDERGTRGGTNEMIVMDFAAPIFSIGFEFPGALRIDLYSAGAFLGSSDDFAMAGTGFFGGVTTDTGFDRVVLVDWFLPDVAIDNVYFGAPASVPEPGVSVAMALGLLGLAGRRGRRV